MKTALGGIRILDMAGVEGQLCGRLLADLGAEVIKVEPPQGDPARRIGPFRLGAPDGEASLRFLHLNTNKKSVTLDLTTGQGRETFRGLARTADAIIETSVEGVFEYESLREENPALVVVSITGFGPDGPYSGFKAPSIVVSAMGGVMYLCGSPRTGAIGRAGIPALPARVYLRRIWPADGFEIPGENGPRPTGGCVVPRGQCITAARSGELQRQ